MKIARMLVVMTRPLRQLLRSRILQVGKPIDHVQWLGPHTHICMAGYTKLLTIQDAMGYPFPVAWGGPLILDYMSVHTLGLWLSYYYGRSQPPCPFGHVDGVSVCTIDVAMSGWVERTGEGMQRAAIVVRQP